ncbi:hypothetical protein CALVIDRAFT_534860 [Calocera viscosa TUFC12733]|uniref:Uncharacterized protein n=1 Tax=Calocera viscosa (strain TUFC12733) TaxID=1330018 RepID=A0A167PH74_CALVF|nr:hypothetical protein CALVIDRAFT_534860 [Calocera viscosa TUFC12733]
MQFRNLIAALATALLATSAFAAPVAVDTDALAAAVVSEVDHVVEGDGHNVTKPVSDVFYCGWRPCIAY